MSVMLDRLRRFRPVGTPGSAGPPVGVPVDTRSGVPAELVGVFDALDEVIADCRDVRARAEQEAADLVAAAKREAAGLVDGAGARVPAERAEAAAGIRAGGEAAAERVLVAATAEADLVIRRGQERMDELVALIVARVRDSAGRAGVE
ncbi:MULTISPECIES: hypothetical protein [unclassified Kribbella]|uniref:hypothetical protein n=1 Tax=unclassified Kribbella TaxID=2644121 RepID=UPI003018B86D